MRRLKQMLTEHEGLKQHGYVIDGKLHIGVGRNILEGSGLGLSLDEIDKLLDNDITICMRELAQNFAWFKELDEVRQEVCIMMSFNLGLPRYKLFAKHIQALSEGDFAEAAIQMLDSLWAKQLPSRAQVLAKMMESGSYPDE